MEHSVIKSWHWVGVSPFQENPPCSPALQSLSTGSYVQIPAICQISYYFSKEASCNAINRPKLPRKQRPSDGCELHHKPSERKVSRYPCPWRGQTNEKREQPVEQLMAPLPPIRLQMTTETFTNCAFDFGGPYLNIQDRGRYRDKCYLFVLVIANPLLSFRDGNLIGTRHVSRRICANGGKKRMVYENAKC